MSTTENPLLELDRDRELARQSGDPCVDLCALTTVSSDGQPSCRMLVVREITESGVTVFCSRTSPKWREIRDTRNYEVLFFWPTVLRQVRLRGSFEELPRQDVADHWEKKTHGAKLLDHFYDRFRAQSEVLNNRQELTAGVEKLRREYPEGAEMGAPESAAGLRFLPDRVEIWRGSADRLHDRVLYVLENGVWQKQWLVP